MRHKELDFCCWKHYYLVENYGVDENFSPIHNKYPETTLVCDKKIDYLDISFKKLNNIVGMRLPNESP